MALLMRIINLTPDSFWPQSRALPEELPERMKGADIADLGAVSTRPGAPYVSAEEEWARLEPALNLIAQAQKSEATGIRLPRISIDTFREETVRRAYSLIGPFIVNDVRAGDDPAMLETVARLHLTYVAMHHRGDPLTMDSLCDYGPEGVTAAVLRFFEDFEAKAAACGIEDWILDPGFGFAKTEEQNMELLRALPRFQRFGRPILVGISDKRFTHGRSAELEAEAVRLGAAIVRRH